MKQTILYIGNFSFPFGNAAGKRVYANGKLLRDIGYDVIYIGTNNEIANTEDIKSTKKEYDGFTYYELAYPKKNIDWINYKQIYNKLSDFLFENHITSKLGFIIYYGSPRLSLFVMQLIKFGRVQKIKVLSDCVDWLTIKTDNVLFDSIKWADNTYQKAYANKQTDGIITITSYLSNYYNKSGCKTVVIPPLSNFESVLVNNVQSETKVLTYAGLPFRLGKKINDYEYLKDRIDKTIIYLHKAKQENCDFIFNIYGFTKEDYLQAIPSQKALIEDLGNNIVFHGRKFNDEVVEAVAMSDFTILVRDVNRDSTAGFPTKVSESISYGTPVITTKTSDLEEYITHGENGFFIDLENDESAINDLIKILNINREDINTMKRKCAESKLFYYKNYRGKMSEFLHEVLNN